MGRNFVRVVAVVVYSQGHCHKQLLIPSTKVCVLDLHILAGTTLVRDVPEGTRVFFFVFSLIMC